VNLRLVESVESPHGGGGAARAGDWVGGSDCLHPTDSGYDEVTEAFEEALGHRSKPTIDHWKRGPLR
jgi:hypothetical protein